MLAAFPPALLSFPSDPEHEENSMGKFPGRLLDERAVAEGLGVSVKTLQNWRCTGAVSLPFVKVGRLVRYQEDEISAFIARSTVSAAAER